MNKRTSRQDDFDTRRKHLEKLSDEDLKKSFWKLADETVKPLVDLAYTHTTPAIERSIILRMGFSSIEAKDLVEKAIANNLISKGVGHCVYRLSKIQKIDIRSAGLKLLNNEGWNEVLDSFGVKKDE